MLYFGDEARRVTHWLYWVHLDVIIFFTDIALCGVASWGKQLNRHTYLSFYIYTYIYTLVDYIF